MGESDVPLTHEAMKLLFAEQASSIRSVIREEVKILGDELQLNLESQLLQLNDKGVNIQTDFRSQIDKLTSDIETCRHDNNNNDDDMQRMNKLNELKITGIAHASNQNLHLIFCEIAKITHHQSHEFISEIQQRKKCHQRLLSLSNLWPTIFAITSTVSTSIK